MSQRRRTYGRGSTPNENTRNFIQEMKSGTIRRKHLQANNEKSSTTQNPSNVFVPSSQVSQHNNKQSTYSSRKRKRSKVEDEITTFVSDKKYLPSPPPMEEFVTDQHETVLHRPSRSYEKRLNGEGNGKSDVCSTTSTLVPVKIQYFDTPPSSASPPPSDGTYSITASAVSIRETEVNAVLTNLDCEMMTSTSTSNITSCAAGTALNSLSYQILGDILSYVLDTYRTVRPFYVQGTMKYGIRSATCNDEDVVTCDNVDLSVLLVSKFFNEVGSNLYYGSNWFRFSNPDACG